MWDNLSLDVALEFASYDNNYIGDEHFLFTFNQHLKVRENMGLAGRVEDVVRERSEITTREICAVLGLEPRHGQLKMVGHALRNLGWKQRLKRRNNVRWYVYRRTQ
jgi:hypothetical protein